jgi:hypothetical protein
MPHHGIHDIGVVVHLEDQPVEIEQVNRIVPEGRPIAAEDSELAVVLERIVAYVRHIHPFRVGPGVRFYFGYRRGMAQRSLQRHAISVTVAFDAERRAVGRFGVLQVLRWMRLIGSRVPGEHAPEVIADVTGQALFVREIEVSTRQRFPLGRGA